MYRDILVDLLAWKDSTRRKPLIIKGVRQCGKTYIMKAFAEQAFKHQVYINLEKNQLARAAFHGGYDVHAILKELELITSSHKIVPGESVVILDEIQSCPEAITSLKYFYEDMPELHIMCAGSLLGVPMSHEGYSFPVGKVNIMRLYPMSFKEFVQACDPHKMLNILSGYDISRALTSEQQIYMERLYRNYLIIGGMPEAVATWIETNDFAQVQQVQEEIIESYKGDFSKYASKTEAIKLSAIWDSIPGQLSKDNHKFIFSYVAGSKRAAELTNALHWLIEAGLIYCTTLTTDGHMPLSISEDKSTFRVYLADVGLLRTIADVSPQSILSDTALFSNFRGGFTENFVNNELRVYGHNPHYWTSSGIAEVDFVIQNQLQVYPIEVKSADNTKAKSLNLFCKKYNIHVAFKSSLKNIGIEKQDDLTYPKYKIALPLYMLWKISQYMTLE